MERRDREEEIPTAAKSIGHVEMREPDFPELTKIRAQDRMQHVQKAMEMGATREEAERHADEDLHDREESHN